MENETPKANVITKEKRAIIDERAKQRDEDAELGKLIDSKPGVGCFSLIMIVSVFTACIAYSGSKQSENLGNAIVAGIGVFGVLVVFFLVFRGMKSDRKEEIICERKGRLEKLIKEFGEDIIPKLGMKLENDVSTFRVYEREEMEKKKLEFGTTINELRLGLCKIPSVPASIRDVKQWNTAVVSKIDDAIFQSLHFSKTLLEKYDAEYVESCNLELRVMMDCYKEKVEELKDEQSELAVVLTPPKKITNAFLKLAEKIVAEEKSRE